VTTRIGHGEAETSGSPALLADGRLPETRSTLSSRWLRRAVVFCDWVGASVSAVTSSEDLTQDEQQRVSEGLRAEYTVLMSALGAAWNASLVRTSIFIFTLSAAGVALGAAQGGLDRTSVRLLALLVLPLVLFLGVATFVRLVQVQRESIIYITGLTRIRHFLQQQAPTSRPYFVLPAHDDERSLYRNIGTGMSRRPPRYRMIYMIVQTQGIVGVITAAVAAAFVGLGVAPYSTAAAWIVAALAFALALAALVTYWQRSLGELRASIRPLNPTPADQMDTPF